MRKIQIFIIAILTILGLGVAIADVAINKHPVINAKNNQTQSRENNQADNAILLYGNPKHGKILAKLRPNARLVPIFQKGDWVKVGDPKNGQVGWVNLVQYQKARYNYYRPDIQTLYVQVDNKNGKGKPTLNIVAYKNGKQVTPEQAQKLYQHLQKMQQQQFDQMHRFTLNMQKMMDQDFRSAERFFNATGFNPPWIGPVILIQTPKPQNNDNPAAKRTTVNKASTHQSAY